MSLWHIHLQTHAIWTVQRPRDYSTMHDDNLLRLSWRQLGSFHTRLQRLWKRLLKLSCSLDQDPGGLHQETNGVKLGKIPLYDTRGSSARAYHLEQRTRGGQGQDRGHPKPPLPGTVRDLRSFLGHVGFYRRFIQDFAKVSKPLTTLLCKDKDFIIDEEGKHAFMMLKQALIEAPILQSPNWDLPFKII